jgi:hypothetical protein
VDFERETASITMTIDDWAYISAVLVMHSTDTMNVRSLSAYDEIDRQIKAHLTGGI